MNTYKIRNKKLFRDIGIVLLIGLIVSSIIYIPNYFEYKNLYAQTSELELDKYYNHNLLVKNKTIKTMKNDINQTTNALTDQLNDLLDQAESLALDTAKIVSDTSLSLIEQINEIDSLISDEEEKLKVQEQKEQEKQAQAKKEEQASSSNSNSSSTSNNYVSSTNSYYSASNNYTGGSTGGGGATSNGGGSTSTVDKSIPNGCFATESEAYAYGDAQFDDPTGTSVPNTSSHDITGFMTNHCDHENANDYQYTNYWTIYYFDQNGNYYDINGKPVA